MTPDVEFVDPIQGTDTYEWRCRRCGDYIVSRRRPRCENCDAPGIGVPPWPERDLVPLQDHEKVNR